MNAKDAANSALLLWAPPRVDVELSAAGPKLTQWRDWAGAAEPPGATSLPTSALRNEVRWARTLAPVLLLIVFWLDVLAPMGVAVPALYVAPALLFLRTGRFWEPLLVAAGATAATIGALYLSPAGGSAAIARLNLPVEVLIVWLTAAVVSYHRVSSDRWADRVACHQRRRKAAEAKLAEQAALAQLGELAAIVAHEVRNPLAGLRGSLEVLQPRFASRSRDRRVIQVMIERIDTLNAKVTDILRFARPQAPVLRPVELSSIIRDAVTSATAAVSRDSVHVVLPSESVMVCADPEMLRGALLNLLQNAYQAGATRVDVRTSSEGEHCRIAITDNGSGIPADVADRVFDAFYTTKKTGTGLGLPIVKRFMDLQHGTVVLKAREGGGTVAELTIAVAQDDGHAAAAGAAPCVNATGVFGQARDGNGEVSG